MTSERIQRRIDQFLDQADAALDRLDWPEVRARGEAVLALDPENADARTLIEAVERANAAPTVSPAAETLASPPVGLSSPQPASFANGRYTVKRFLGEGGKKKVYLAHDASLDRNVAFALIKTEGMNQAAGSAPHVRPKRRPTRRSPENRHGLWLRRGAGSDLRPPTGGANPCGLCIT